MESVQKTHKNEETFTINIGCNYCYNDWSKSITLNIPEYTKNVYIHIKTSESVYWWEDKINIKINNQNSAKLKINSGIIINENNWKYSAKENILKLSNLVHKKYSLVIKYE